MRAYADRVILRMKTSSTSGIEVESSLPEGEVVSIGHLPTTSLVPSAEEDPLEIGQVVVLDTNARGIEIEIDGEKLHLFRKMQILYIK